MSEPYVPSEAEENATDAMEEAGYGATFTRVQIAKIKAGALRGFAADYRRRYAEGYVLTSHASQLADEVADRIEQEARDGK